MRVDEYIILQQSCAWPALLAIGGRCGRGMCPLLPKVEAFGIFSLINTFSIDFHVFHIAQLHLLGPALILSPPKPPPVYTLANVHTYDCLCPRPTHCISHFLFIGMCY